MEDGWSPRGWVESQGMGGAQRMGGAIGDGWGPQNMGGAPEDWVESQRMELESQRVKRRDGCVAEAITSCLSC